MYFTLGRAGSLFAVLLGTALCASPQAYTISARPGAINYIEGTALLNGRSISTTKHSTPFLATGDTLSTVEGKTEVLLTPGVFLRIGENSAIDAKSISLTDIQLNLQRGEAMLEVNELLPDNEIRILSQGATVQVLKPGLYRFTAGPDATAATITGKAGVSLGAKTVNVGSGHEVALEPGLRESKFDKKKPDELYAWSNVRSEYAAAASLQSARSMPVDSTNSNGSTVSSGYGMGSSYGPYGTSGWAWNGLFDSWAWVPEGDLAFFNPFGYGFFAPGVVAYAPLYYVRQPWGGAWNGGVGRVPVAVNPNHPPAIGVATNSVAANQSARSAAMQSYVQTGFRTPTGQVVPAGLVMASTPTAGSTHWSGAVIAHSTAVSAGGVSHGGFGGATAHAGGFSGVSVSSGGHAGTGGGGGHH